MSEELNVSPLQFSEDPQIRSPIQPLSQSQSPSPMSHWFNSVQHESLPLQVSPTLVYMRKKLGWEFNTYYSAGRHADGEEFQFNLNSFSLTIFTISIIQPVTIFVYFSSAP